MSGVLVKRLGRKKSLTGRRRLEIERIYILILLGRILGVFDRAVGPMTKPFGMLARPRMVGRALDCEVERDFQSQTPSGRHEMIEILETAERRLDRGMAASLAANRPGAAGTVGARGQRVVRALAMRVANRMYRRKINHVEAEVMDCRQPALGLPQRRGAPRNLALGAREHLVPGAETRQWPVR